MRAAVSATLAALLALTLAPVARAQVVSERPEQVGVTVYRDRSVDTRTFYPDPDYPENFQLEAAGLLMVTETRTVDIPAGRSTISFRGVADGIVPQTAAIEGLPGEMVERNQDYDLLSAGALIAKSMDRPIRLIRTDKDTGAVTEQVAIVRSGPDGVMLEIDGKLEALRCSGLPERVVFDRLPAGLSDKPTLSVVVNAPAPGRHKVRLTYLAVGLTWSADYVARIRPDGKTLDLTGWVTLANGSGSSFADAKTQVVAGNLAMEDETEPTPIEALALATACWPMPYYGRRPPVALPADVPAPAPSMLMVGAMAYETDVDAIVVTGSRIVEQSDLGDYKLYTVPEPTSVAARQVKQVMLLQEEAVPFERVYRFDVDLDALDDLSWEYDEREEYAPTVELRLMNTRAEGLGKALPSGNMAVMDASGGRTVLIGEDRIKDIPVGLPVELKLGGSMGVAVRTGVTTDWSPGDEGKGKVVVEIRNDKPGPIVVEIRQALQYNDNQVLISGESHPHADRQGDRVWTVRVAANGRAELRYTVRLRETFQP